MCKQTIQNISQLIKEADYKPIFGICLGHQLLSLAIGASTYKMKCVFFLDDISYSCKCIQLKLSVKSKCKSFIFLEATILNSELYKYEIGD